MTEFTYPTSWLETDQYSYSVIREYRDSGDWHIWAYFGTNKSDFIKGFSDHDKARSYCHKLAMDLYWERQKYRRERRYVER
jgi:hypothetical protein